MSLRDDLSISSTILRCLTLVTSYIYLIVDNSKCVHLDLEIFYLGLPIIFSSSCSLSPQSNVPFFSMKVACLCDMRCPTLAYHVYFLNIHLNIYKSPISTLILNPAFLQFLSVYADGIILFTNCDFRIRDGFVL